MFRISRFGFRISALRILAIASTGLLLAGCTTPNKANIELRKQNATLQSQLQQLKIKNNALVARIAGIQNSATTLPTLPPQRLDLLFTAHLIKISKLSAGSDLYDTGHGQTGIRLYVAPIDEMGNPIQATGYFTIDAYDLSDSHSQHIGHWTRTPLQCKDDWTIGFFRQAYYMFDLPYQQLPKSPNITIHVTFRDELTTRFFVAQQVIQVQPTNSHLPTTRPSQDHTKF